MTAAPNIALNPDDPDSDPEPAWTPEDFEALSEDAVVGLLLRRMRRLAARGFDPAESLIAASRAHLPIP